MKRNIERFPDEFCFQLNDSEFHNWKSQFATSNSDKMGLRKKPYAFTEHGVTMLATVLKSETAAKASIQIVKAFVAMRKFLLNNQTLYHIGASLKDLGKRCFAFDVFDSTFIADIMARL